MTLLTPNITSQQLLIDSLTTLSTSLEQKIDTALQRIASDQQNRMNQALLNLIPTLFQQLSPIIATEIKKQNQPMLKQVENCLTELRITNSEQVKMLKLGRQEYQILQERMTVTLNQLEQLSLLDENDIMTSLNELQNLMTLCQASYQTMLNEQAELSQLVDDLENLKMDMETTLENLKQQQIRMENSLQQFQPLLK